MRQKRQELRGETASEAVPRMLTAGDGRGPVTYRIIGAFLGVYRALGWGLPEAVYRRSMGIALAEVGARVAAEAALPVHFHGTLVGPFRADLIVDRCVLVELKTSESILPPHRAQLLTYLRASDFERGLLLNFGPQPQFERFILGNDRKRRTPDHRS